MGILGKSKREKELESQNNQLQAMMQQQQQQQQYQQLPSGGDLLGALTQPAEEKTDLSKVVDQLLNTDNESFLLERLTELDQQQINVISILLAYSEEYKIHVLKDFIYKYLSLMFSKSRKRSGEIVDMFKSHQNPPMDFGAMGGGGKGSLINRMRR
jgi:hypothetical protein